jgi:hypothetical protein
MLHAVFVEMVAYPGIGIVQGSGGNETIHFPYFQVYPTTWLEKELYSSK